jgi:hypothetical protein
MQTVLRHGHLKTTQRYADSSTERMRELSASVVTVRMTSLLRAEMSRSSARYDGGDLNRAASMIDHK